MVFYEYSGCSFYWKINYIKQGKIKNGKREGEFMYLMGMVIY